MKRELIFGDCLEKMRDIPDGSIDAVICDPPYQITACRWDKIIPFEPMWEQLKRITKKNRAIVLFASQPFTSALVMSNPKMFKYEWVWNRKRATGFQVCNVRPMIKHENILVFGDGKIVYNPQKVKKDKPRFGGKVNKKFEAIPTPTYENRIIEFSYPNSILTYKKDTGFHPTQKPVALCEYLIKTYTSGGEMVLDFAMGSGTTGVAAVNLGRSFIGIEIDETYFNIAKERIKQAQAQMKLL